jgi:hypothetical protein
LRNEPSCLERKSDIGLGSWFREAWDWSRFRSSARERCSELMVSRSESLPIGTPTNGPALTENTAYPSGMYITTRKPKGSTIMTCADCGHEIRMNDVCQKPLQSATGMLKHIAAHNASHAFARAERVTRSELTGAVAASPSLSTPSAEPAQLSGPILAATSLATMVGTPTVNDSPVEK